MQKRSQNGLRFLEIVYTKVPKEKGRSRSGKKSSNEKKRNLYKPTIDGILLKKLRLR